MTGPEGVAAIGTKCRGNLPHVGDDDMKMHMVGMEGTDKVWQ